MPTSPLKSLLTSLAGGGGAGTTGETTGTGGGTMDALSGILGGLGSWWSQNNAQDYLKQQLERAVSIADPFAANRQQSGNLLMQSYTDPTAIWNAPYMQTLDQQFQNSQLARDAQAGQLFNAPERLSQREANFYNQLNQYRQPLLSMSGANANPASAAAAITGMSGPIAFTGLNAGNALGYAGQQGLNLLGGMFGGTGTSGGTSGGMTLQQLLGLGGTTGGSFGSGTVDPMMSYLYNWTA